MECLFGNDTTNLRNAYVGITVLLDLEISLNKGTRAKWRVYYFIIYNVKNTFESYKEVNYTCLLL